MSTIPDTMRLRRVRCPRLSDAIYLRDVSEKRVADAVEVERCVGIITTRLSERVNDISHRIWRELEDQVAELRGDARLSEMFGASVRGNIDTVLQALNRHDNSAERIAVPKAALEYAKRLAQQGIPVNALIRTYRLGQRRMTELVFSELRSIEMDAAVQVAVIEAITTVIFEYVDWVSEKTVAAYEEEHDQWLENQNSIRAMRVRDVLGDVSDIDGDAASDAIGYPLRCHHLALIVWYRDTASENDELPRLQLFADNLAAKVATSADPLFAAADRTSAWIWLPYRSAPGDVVAKIRDYAHARSDTFSIAMGAMGLGVNGFRRSHRQAQRARAAVLARGWEQRTARREVVAATDPDMVDAALLGTSTSEIREWVAEVLGPLASDSDHDARLREMLRTYLSTGSGFESAARKFNLTYNVLKDQVERAVARRGRPIDDRLDVSLALLVCHRYGTAVLQPATESG